MKSRKERILIAVDNLVANLLYYDRKEDEDLPVGEIEKAIQLGEISVQDMVDLFHFRLRANIK